MAEREAAGSRWPGAGRVFTAARVPGRYSLSAWFSSDVCIDRCRPELDQCACRLGVSCSGVLLCQSTSIFTLARWRDTGNHPRQSAVR